MFTGIIRGVLKIIEVDLHDGLLSYAIEFPMESALQLTVGASVSIDGVCQTVTRIEGHTVWFDAIEETLRRTTLSGYKIGQQVNIERAAKFGDEIGGHILSGHVYGTAAIEKKIHSPSSCILWMRCPPTWMKYFFTKGYVALNGASLTVVDVDPAGLFSVHLIPETLRATTLGSLMEGDHVNVELDTHTQMVVDTLERQYRPNDFA